MKLRTNPREYAELIDKAAGLPGHTGVLQHSRRTVSAPDSTLHVQEVEADEEGEFFEVTERVRRLIDVEDRERSRLTPQERARLVADTPARGGR